MLLWAVPDICVSGQANEFAWGHDPGKNKNIRIASFPKEFFTLSVIDKPLKQAGQSVRLTPLLQKTDCLRRENVVPQSHIVLMVNT